MRIAVDGYELGSEARGVGRVVHNILVHLVDCLPDDDFIVYTKERVGLPLRLRAREHVLSSGGGYLRWLNGPLRRALLRDKPDIFFATNYLLPLRSPWESLLYEHDISVVSHPEWYPRMYALTRRFLTARSLVKARRVVVPSEFTRQEILSCFRLDPEKIFVCGHGLEEKFRKAGDKDVLEWKRKKGLEGKTVVGYLGALNKRRHIPVLVRAVELLKAEIPEIVLVIVGKDVRSFSRQEMAQFLSREWVRWEESLPEEELPLFFSALDVFAFLSEYEGFGLPPLEALACGSPLVLLDRPPLSEIFSGLAFMVERPEAGEVKKVLAAGLSDEARRDGQLRLFDERRGQFSWQSAARKIAGVLANWPSGRT
ncbi:MAG: glycosyltransferase family 1 protein [Clostridiales bacterium]|nr:glycosyltransferase family 1 protein [Clostridiales bacterium]